MMSNELEVRMKAHEVVFKNFVKPHVPVVIRIDGKAFHTFTRGLAKPLDETVTQAMLATVKYLCANIQNCKLGYTQSDEISLLLVDYERPESEQWFSGNVQKMVSVAASMATLAFNKAFRENVQAAVDAGQLPADAVHLKRVDTATFDARVFEVPVDDVVDYLNWRQADCARNFIEACGRTRYSQKQLSKISCRDLRLMMLDDGFDVTAQPTSAQLGFVVRREVYELDNEQRTLRSRWTEFTETPRFARSTIVDDLVRVGEHQRTQTID